MGKLNIAHHKSYHPYRLDNVERVRKDEEEARLKEEREEGRMMLADSEARIQLLRERAGTSKTKSKRKQEEEAEAALLAQATTARPAIASGSAASVGHINFFEDLEQNAVNAAILRSREADKLVKGKGQTAETEKGYPLAPSAKDLKPWYSAKAIEPDTDMDDDKRKKDLSHKSRSDPLRSINQQLASRYPSSPSSSQRPPYRTPNVPASSSSQPTTDLDSRLQRESSERQRALDLIRRKKREMDGSETPSTIHGGYGNQFNRREVEEAHAQRDRGRGRDWARGRGYWGDGRREDRRGARDHSR